MIIFSYDWAAAAIAVDPIPKEKLARDKDKDKNILHLHRVFCSRFFIFDFFNNNSNARASHSGIKSMKCEKGRYSLIFFLLPTSPFGCCFVIARRFLVNAKSLQLNNEFAYFEKLTAWKIDKSLQRERRRLAFVLANPNNSAQTWYLGYNIC